MSISDSIDWEDPDAATIQSRILSGAGSGSILLFHNDLPNTEEALPYILTELRKRGFDFVKTEELIYFDSYRIDSTGKQIYEPNLTASAGTVIYADDSYADSAFEKIRLNLTLEEIYKLSTYGSDKVAIIERTRDFLTPAEIAALQMMSFEDLQSAYGSLVYAAETYGAGGIIPPEQGIYSEADGEENEPDGGENAGGENASGENASGAGEQLPPVTEETEYPPMIEDDPPEYSKPENEPPKYDEEVTVK